MIQKHNGLLNFVSVQTMTATLNPDCCYDNPPNTHNQCISVGNHFCAALFTDCWAACFFKHLSHHWWLCWTIYTHPPPPPPTDPLSLFPLLAVKTTWHITFVLHIHFLLSPIPWLYGCRLSFFLRFLQHSKGRCFRKRTMLTHLFTNFNRLAFLITARFYTKHQ